MGMPNEQLVIGAMAAESAVAGGGGSDEERAGGAGEVPARAMWALTARSNTSRSPA